MRPQDRARFYALIESGFNMKKRSISDEIVRNAIANLAPYTPSRIERARLAVSNFISPKGYVSQKEILVTASQLAGALGWDQQPVEKA